MGSKIEGLESMVQEGIQTILQDALLLAQRASGNGVSSR